MGYKATDDFREFCGLPGYSGPGLSGAEIIQHSGLDHVQVSYHLNCGCNFAN